MAHEHSLYDNDKHFSIDPITRQIKNESGKIILINHDHNSERFTFEIPKEVDGHDMSLCNVVQIHYLNVEKETKTEYEGIYEVDDLQISPISKDVVICSWLISRNATQYVGSLHFVVLFECVADDGTVEYAWSTAIHEGIAVSDGIYNSDVVVSEYSDILEQWRQKLIAASIGEDVEPAEVRESIGAVAMASETLVLTASGWSNNEQWVQSILEYDRFDTVFVSPEPTDTNYQAYTECGIRCIGGDGQGLGFVCDEIPSINITVNTVGFK